MAKINLIYRDTDAKEFCRKCRGYFGGTMRHCNRGCLWDAARFTQRRCDEGASISTGFDAWTAQTITHREGREIIEDAIGMDLDDARAILRGDE